MALTETAFDAKRFVSGDRDYLTEVIREYSPLVLLVCQSFASDYDQVQDLSQETWKAVCTNAHMYNGSGSFKAWLHRITTNVCRSGWRSDKVRFEGLDRYGKVVRTYGEWHQVDPLSETERRELHRAILRALPHLTNGERVAITLRILEGRSPQDVADKMGIALATVRSHVRHGMRHLQEIMEEPGSELGWHRPPVRSDNVEDGAQRRAG